MWSSYNASLNVDNAKLVKPRAEADLSMMSGMAGVAELFDSGSAEFCATLLHHCLALQFLRRSICSLCVWTVGALCRACLDVGMIWRTRMKMVSQLTGWYA